MSGAALQMIDATIMCTQRARSFAKSRAGRWQNRDGTPRLSAIGVAGIGAPPVGVRADANSRTRSVWSAGSKTSPISAKFYFRNFNSQLRPVDLCGRRAPRIWPLSYFFAPPPASVPTSGPRRRIVSNAATC